MKKFTGKMSLLKGAALVALMLGASRSPAQIITNAYDVAANYSGAGNFVAGDNLGSGFGPWAITTGDGGQTLTANDAAQFGSYAFTLTNSSANGITIAERPLSSPLPVGGSFSVRFRLNHLDNSSNTNGIQFKDAGGNVLFSFFHKGGDNANGWFIDAAGSGTATNFSYNFSAFTSLTFTLTSATTYTFMNNNNGASFSGTLAGAAITQVAFFRANGITTTSDGQNFDFNALAITTLGSKPVFSLHPKSGATVVGGSLTLSAAATSNLGTPNYQWYFTNGPIAGATSTNLLLVNLKATNAGSYYVVASNTAGMATSTVAIVTIIPFGYTNAYDVAANYSSFAGNQGYGFGPWALSTAGGGSYLGGGTPPVFAIWNGAAYGTSTAVRTFNSPLPVGGSFLVQLQMNSLAANNTNAFELQDASGNVVFSYFHMGGDNADGWYTDATGTGTATGFAFDFQQLDTFAFTLTSATTYTFTDFATGASFTGTLSGAEITQVTFRRANGDAAPPNGQDFKFTSLTMLTTTGTPPQFTQQPQYNGGLVGSTLALNAAAVSGVGTVNYQWYFGGARLAGETNATLTLGNVGLASSGAYYLVASNSFGSVTSVVSVVTVYVENSRLLAYEGFNYAGDPTAIDGVSQNGGLGWNGAWTVVSGLVNYINPGSLFGGANAPMNYDAGTIGNSYYNYGSSRTGRFLDTSTNGAFAARGYLDASGNIGAPGKTLYVSFLIQPDTTAKFYEFEFHLNDLDDGGRLAGIGNDTVNTNVYFREPSQRNGPYIDLGLGDSYGDPLYGNHAVDLYVVRIDFQPGHADNVKIYRDPTSLEEPETPTAALTNVGNMSFNGFSLGAFGNLLAIDEIRVGGTWSDALGMPGVNHMLQPVRQGNEWSIHFSGNPAYTYRVQRASSLTDSWIDIGTATPAENGIGIINDPNPPAGEAYYRTVTP